MPERVREQLQVTPKVLDSVPGLPQAAGQFVEPLLIQRQLSAGVAVGLESGPNILG